MSLTLDNTQDVEDALAPGTTLLNKQYKIERYLSAGGFGITYLAKDSLMRPVVIKECFPEAVCARNQKTVCARSRAHQGDFRSFVSLFVREARSLSKLKHPNVVGVHQVFEDNETAYMALDLIEGRDLLTIIEDPKASLTPDQIENILLKTLDAVALIHSQDMLHRDISPDNILIIPDGHPVLIDFGAAREEASKKSRALSSVLVVKDGYSPQEFYFGGSRQGPFSDIYALGATFYHLISGTTAPHSQTRLADIASNNPDPCKPLAGRFPDYDQSFLAAIDDAMSVFPKDRIQSAEEWTSRIIEKRGASAAADLAIQNTINIQSWLKEAPQKIAQRQAAVSTPTIATERTIVSLDFSDLRDKGVQKMAPKRVKYEQPTPQKTGRQRHPLGRAIVSFTLVGATFLAAEVPSTVTPTPSISAAISTEFSSVFTFFSPAPKGSP